jgi:hypothetical protein
MPQSNWRRCKKCYGLFFAGNPGSVCPAGGQHDFTGTPFNFNIDFAGDPTGGQPNWQWCHKCQGLFYAGIGGQIAAWVRRRGHALLVEYIVTPGAPVTACTLSRQAGTVDLTSGTCPAGGGHNYGGSGNYGLATI